MMEPGLVQLLAPVLPPMARDRKEDICGKTLCLRLLVVGFPFPAPLRPIGIQKPEEGASTRRNNDDAEICAVVIISAGEV